jgi:hypothetical protein
MTVLDLKMAVVKLHPTIFYLSSPSVSFLTSLSPSIHPVSGETSDMVPSRGSVE